MERALIGSTGFAIALADGYTKIDAHSLPDCVFARKGPSGKMAIFAYAYESSTDLQEQLDALMASITSRIETPAESDNPEREDASNTPAVDGHLAEKCGEACAVLEYPLGQDPARTDERYPNYANHGVRSCLFKKDTLCTRIDIVYDAEIRRQADALFSNIMAAGR